MSHKMDPPNDGHQWPPGVGRQTEARAETMRTGGAAAGSRKKIPPPGHPFPEPQPWKRRRTSSATSLSAATM